MESTGGRACDDDPAGGFLVPWLDTLTGEAPVGAHVTSIPNKSDPATRTGGAWRVFNHRRPRTDPKL